jgi:hypothetical protein
VAFSYGGHQEEIAKRTGYYKGTLLKSLYGLKVAPRAWFLTLSRALRTIGWVSCAVPGFWFKKHPEYGLSFLICYVDDLVVLCRSEIFTASLLAEIFKLFPGDEVMPKETKVPGWLLQDILGVEVYHNFETRRIKFCMEKYIEKQTKVYGADKLRKVRNPVFDVDSLRRCTAPPAEDNNLAALVGVFMWVAVSTRPDIMASVRELSMYLQTPNKEAYGAGLKILNYLYHTKTDGPSYSPFQEHLFNKIYKVDCEVVMFSDASFGTADKMYSVTGTAIFFRGVIIGWKTTRQSVRSYSTTESEFIGCSDSIIFSEQHEDLFIFVLGSRVKGFPIFMDSETAIKIAVGEDYKPKSRHYAFRYYRVIDNKKRLRFTTTELMRADPLTKVGCSEIQRQLLLKVQENELRRRRPTAATSAWGGM